ncbi:ribosomal protein S5 domain 2-type protein [Tuber brumale]|nr:ribosomal protein S5 domain 2-type protein [Tuber brumale]
MPPQLRASHPKTDPLLPPPPPPNAMPNEDLTDEISALNSIYTPETIIPCSPTTKTYTLTLPTQIPRKLTLSFPDTYPSDPPTIHGTSNIAGAAGFARDVLGRIFRQGEVCLYDFVEGLVEVLQARGGVAAAAPVEEAVVVVEEQDEDKEEEEKGSWTIAPPLTEKKSVFIARVIHVSSPDQAKAYLCRLLTDKKIVKATHNISAYRIKDPYKSVVYQDNDDDGEAAAGGRLAHLLQVMDVWDVLVVVSRWYGGVKLGPDRSVPLFEIGAWR